MVSENGEIMDPVPVFNGISLMEIDLMDNMDNSTDNMEIDLMDSIGIMEAIQEEVEDIPEGAEVEDIPEGAEVIPVEVDIRMGLNPIKEEEVEGPQEGAGLENLIDFILKNI